MTHPIETYLGETGESKTDFAKRAGISKMHLWRLLDGRSGFSLPTLQRISAATGEKIEINELISAMTETAA